MRNGIQAVFEKLRTCGTLAGLPVHLRGIGRRSAVQKANTHVHLPPNFSAFENAAHAVSLAAQQGLVALGASNYYDFEVYGEFAASCLRSRIYPLFGVEIVALLKDLQRTGVLINDPTNPGRMYLCGKGIVRLAPMTAVARDLMGRIRLNDAKRMRRMVDLVRTVFEANNVETDLSEEVIVSRIVNRCGADRESVCLQERHVAQAFQEEFFRRVPPNERMPKLGALLGRQPRAAVDDPLMVQQEIRACLMKAGKPAFVPERFVNFQDAYRLILELGGIPCYPTLADGAEPVCSYEECPEKLVRTLKRLRVFCAEFIPTRNKPEVLVRYVHELRDEGIVVTAGTEHNTPDLLPLEPRCAGGRPVPADIEDVFWEGACVVAAHQYLLLQGERGYVDSDGCLNPSFGGVEEHIDRLRRLGEAVIERYRSSRVGQGASSGDV